MFLPDGKRIASASNNKTVQLWDAEKGEANGTPLEGHHESVVSVMFSPDGKRIASVSYNNMVWLWDVEKGEPIGAPLEGHHDWVVLVVFSPDRKRIALLKYLGAEHANCTCFLIRKILTFTFILLHSLLTYFSLCTPHFRYLCSISSLHSCLYLHHLSLL